MFVHNIALAAAESQSKYAALYRNTRITMVIYVRQTGQVPPSAATLLAQLSQNLAWPHGTRAKPSRGATRHTSQQSGSVAAAAGSAFVAELAAFTW